MLSTPFLVVLALASVPPGRAERYDGYQVLRAFARTQQDLVNLHDLQRTFLDGQLDVWKEARDVNQTSDMMVPLEFAPALRSRLDSLSVAHQVAVEDVQRLVESEISRPLRRKRAAADVLTKYSSYADILVWLDDIVRICGSRCTLQTVGTSALGQPLKVIKITGATATASKSIFIDGTVHAREWISTVMALNVINKLVTDYGTDVTTTTIVDSFNWYVLPVANPDGYEYSRTTSRLWRKNRRSTSIASCPGTDLNRNFDYHWKEVDTSSYPCDDTFGGSTAFSEPESRAMRDFLLRIGGERVMYLSFHAYGQYWLYSWGYTTATAPDSAEMKAVATVGANAIRKASAGSTATVYTVGSAAGALYPSAGGSDDWAKGVAGFKYSYTVELPPSDSSVGGTSGFILAESKIPKVIKETWSGVQATAAELARKAILVG